MVVADTLDRARDAAEAVAIDWEALPAVVDPERALAPGAPTLWDEAPGNLCFDWECGDAAADRRRLRARRAGRAPARCATTASARPRSSRAARSASTIAATDAYTLHTSSQGSGYLRRDARRAACSAIAPERLRVVTPDVGGAFGAKLFPLSRAGAGPRRRAAASAGRCAGSPTAARPSSPTTPRATRSTRPSSRSTATAASSRCASTRIANLGDALSANAPHVPTTGSNKVLTGVYAIPAAHMRVRGAFTNTAPVEAYRGAGRPESIYVIERLVDRAARELGIDPVALRRLQRRAGSTALPWRTPTGQLLHSVDFGRVLDEAERRADRPGFARRRAASAAAGRRRGLGFSLHLHGTSGMPGERAAIEVRPDGRVVVDTAVAIGRPGPRDRVRARSSPSCSRCRRTRSSVRQGDTAHACAVGRHRRVGLADRDRHRADARVAQR